MELTHKNILLISPEPWNHIFVSKHHYAVHLASRGNKVFFLNPPGSTESVAPTEFPGVCVIDYQGFPTGLRFYPRILQGKIISGVYRQLEAMCSLHFDVIWSFDNSVFYDFSSLPSRLLKVSHIVDANQDFQTKKAATTADFCFCTTEQIRNKLSLYNMKVYKVNHGYNLPLSGNRTGARTPSRKRRAMYAGNLSVPYIDWNLLDQVTADNPDVDFVFIGPNEPDYDQVMHTVKKKLLKRSNVSFTGPVESTKLQEYYSTADVLLVAYQEKYHSEQTANPHKVMEYLGSGKVIVATRTTEYFNLYPLIIMSEKNFEWPGLFRKVIGKLEHYNSREIQGQRMAFALDNSYEQQINKIEQIINN